MNYKWRKAFSVLGIKFSSEDRARENFPELIAFGRIARLQHPTDLRAERTLANAMLDDCKRGDLEHVVKVLPPKAVMNGKIHFVREWGGTQLEAAHTPSPQPKDVTEYQIAAPAFAAWLAALPDKDKTPSEHIAAWFEAVGVNTQPEAAPVPIDETIEDRNDRWLAFYEAEEKAGRKTGAVQRGATHFDVERSLYGKALKESRARRAEKYRADIKAVPAKGGAAGWGSQLVKDGKKTKGTKV